MIIQKFNQFLLTNDFFFLQEGIYQADNTMAPINEAISTESPSTLIVFTNQSDSDNVAENFLQNSPQQWYHFL